MEYQQRTRVSALAPDSKTRRFAVIGAGAAGLCCAKNLIQAGFEDVTIFEIGSQIGGVWCYRNDNERSSAYRTLHINSAKNLTNFSDFPFREDVQMFPDHRDMHKYLVDYAAHFDLTRRIRFNTTIVDVRPAGCYRAEAPLWEVETEHGEITTFDRVMVASGHLSLPMHVNEFREKFSGTYIHSHYYREPEPFVGQRICVVGVGNSACDIASDVCVNSQRTVMVARSGVMIVPKLIFGRPFTDFTIKLERKWVPNWLRSRITSTLVRLFHGRMTDLGFKALAQRAHTTSSAVLVQHIVYDRINVKQGIERIEGNRIHFVDGSNDEFDVLIAATGYQIELPFISESIVPIKDNAVDLYQRIVPPGWDGLYFIGMLNTTTSLPNAFEHQMRWILPFELGQATLPTVNEMHAAIEAKKDFIKRYYKASLRHTIEEPHLIYFRELRKSLKEAKHRARRAPQHPVRGAAGALLREDALSGNRISNSQHP
ncbi:flavin-containing monooxygenase [Paraburkholderia aspalathi]|uniref:Predicted flavoprotein CzcO associated with the cation diffusion facilitator CzcD n=1 Tax=Paraburkholderia aspalathi TaxID=1324617 RepID=A0A1I7ERN2_9BURK|nr:NAD(P)-binding domain-containing protein [Paraburkholderia aspalathi]SFU26566.1 Predicted flavoprotein CzcO associated with the cation diffusion facilitator CzcD [Paraburkholderia aspalathi]